MLHIQTLLIRNDDEIADTLYKIEAFSHYWKGQMSFFIEKTHICIFIGDKHHSFMIHGQRPPGAGRLLDNMSIPVEVALGSPREADVEHPIYRFDFQPGGSRFDYAIFRASVAQMTEIIRKHPPTETADTNGENDYVVIRRMSG